MRELIYPSPGRVIVGGFEVVADDSGRGRPFDRCNFALAGKIPDKGNQVPCGAGEKGAPSVQASADGGWLGSPFWLHEMTDGRQFIALTVGNGAEPAEFVTLALP